MHIDAAIDKIWKTEPPEFVYISGANYLSICAKMQLEPRSGIDRDRMYVLSDNGIEELEERA